MEDKNAGPDLKAVQLAKIREIMGGKAPLRGLAQGNGGDQTDAILRGQDESVEQGPTPEELEAAHRATEMHEAVLAAQDRAIVSVVLIDIFERFGPEMTNTEKLVMLREIKLYNRGYAERVEARMQGGQ